MKNVFDQNEFIGLCKKVVDFSSPSAKLAECKASSQKELNGFVPKH